MCGYSVYDTAAVWVGNDDNTSLYDPSLAKEIWRQVMNAASAGKERKDFDVPDTVEYRNIVSGGSLGDTVYNKKQLDMSKDSYDRRPDGYDYYSTLNAKEAEKYQKEKALILRHFRSPRLTMRITWKRTTQMQPMLLRIFLQSPQRKNTYEGLKNIIKLLRKLITKHGRQG